MGDQRNTKMTVLFNKNNVCGRDVSIRFPFAFRIFFAYFAYFAVLSLRIRFSSRTHFFAYFAVLLSSSLPAFAQSPEITGLLPAGGVCGAATKVVIEGKSLQNATLFFSGGGISSKSQQVSANGEQLTAEFFVETGASLGTHELRIITTKGVSNGAKFFVDIAPNLVIETPMQESAPPIELDGKQIVINSRILSKAGRDRFAFRVKAGEVWTFDCFAYRIRSRFDPVLELRNETGVSLKLVQSTWENDPRFAYRFEKAGRCFLTVHDSEYNGGKDYVYRLKAGRSALLEVFSPLGGRPGETVQLRLQGANLPAEKATVRIPSDARPGTYWTTLFPASETPILAPLLVSVFPTFSARDSGEKVSLPPIPCNVDGVFIASTLHRFSFRAEPKTKISFELFGRRIGSRIDGELRVLDKVGKEVAINDDLSVLCKDSFLEFTAPAEGEYTLEVRNVEEVAGRDCFYRLNATLIVPDFQISIETDRIAIPAGGKMALKADVRRLGGFTGQVEAKFDRLPPGVVASSRVIAPDKNSVEITLTVAPNVQASGLEVHLIGEAKIGWKVVRREAPGWERYEHRSIDLSLSGEYTYTRPNRIWEMLILAITEATPAKK